jgi:hypothetical protein
VTLVTALGVDAIDIGKTVHQHPSLGKSNGMAVEVTHGSCMDVPMVRTSSF